MTCLLLLTFGGTERIGECTHITIAVNSRLVGPRFTRGRGVRGTSILDPFLAPPFLWRTTPSPTVTNLPTVIHTVTVSLGRSPGGGDGVVSFRADDAVL